MSVDDALKDLKIGKPPRSERDDRRAHHLIAGFWGGMFLLGLVAIAAATQLFRYQVQTVFAPGEFPRGLVLRLDRLSGHVDACTVRGNVNYHSQLDLSGWFTLVPVEASRATQIEFKPDFSASATPVTNADSKPAFNTTDKPWTNDPIVAPAGAAPVGTHRELRH